MAITRLGLADPEQAEKPVPLITAALIVSLAIAASAAWSFAWVADEMREGDTVGFDNAIRTWAHGFASPAMTRAMIVTSFMGSRGMIVIMAAAVVLFAIEKWKRGLVWMTLTMIGALVLNVSLKNGFHRARPIPFFGTAPHTYSFPSGHALFSFCFYGVLAGLISDRIRSRRLRVLLWCISALMVVAIGFSRIYLGVHYPSDVVAGYLAGTIWVSTMLVVDRVRQTRKGVKVE